MEAILKPDELHQISDDTEMAELKAALAKRKKAEHSVDELRHTFMARDKAAVLPLVGPRLEIGASPPASILLVIQRDPPRVEKD